MKKFAALLALALLLALTAVPAFGQGGIVYNTGFQVQNLGTAEANVVVTYYNQDGTVAGEESFTIPLGGSKTVFPIAAVPDGFNGSAVISSDQPVAAIGNELGNSTQYGASYSGFSAGATKTSLPLIMCNNSGFDTWFNVQNAGSTDADITITYYPGTDGVSGVTESATIKPGAAKTFNQKVGSTTKNCNDLKGATGKFVGSAVVESTNGVPIVAAVNQVGATTLLAYNGFLGGSTEISVPLVNINNAGYVTGIQVQNTGTSATNITVSFTCSTGGPIADQTQNNIAPNKAATFFLGTTFPKCIGAAKVTNSAGQSLVAIVNQLNLSANKGSAYNGVDAASATEKVSMPLIMDRNGGFFTGFNVQNVGTSTVTVTCTFSNNPRVVTASVAPGAALNDIQLNQLAAGYVGSATCTAPAGSKIIGVVNELSSTGTGDMFFTYNGFSY
jgi:hypothetical protein